jgi:polyisoprenoid-binding protein YceI
LLRPGRRRNRMSNAWIALAAAALAAAPEGRAFSVDPAKSVLGFHIVHKFHKVHGESRSLQGKALLSPDGAVQVMVRAPVASFDSGDGNRDGNMRDTLEAAKYPYVTFKAVGKLTPPKEYPARAEVELDGELDFHGRKRPEKVPVTVEFAAPDALHVTGRFAVSLDKYEVERPSLLFVKIEDACAIDVDFALRGEAR